LRKSESDHLCEAQSYNFVLQHVRLVIQLLLFAHSRVRGLSPLKFFIAECDCEVFRDVARMEHVWASDWHEYIQESSVFGTEGHLHSHFLKGTDNFRVLDFPNA